MKSPYQIDPEALRHRSRRIEEEKVITLQDDGGNRPSPSIGAPGWQNIMAGPLLGQPASDIRTFQHQQSRMSPATAMLLGILALFLGYTLYSQF